MYHLFQTMHTVLHRFSRVDLGAFACLCSVHTVLHRFSRVDLGAFAVCAPSMIWRYNAVLCVQHCTIHSSMYCELQCHLGMLIVSIVLDIASFNVDIHHVL